MRYFIRFILVFCFIHVSYAQSIDVKTFENAKQESRYQTLVDEILCPVCQGQSIGGSNAGLAKDLRDKVRELILRGDTDEQIVKFMTDRYSDKVSLKPPVKPSTYPLWFGAPIFLLIALFFLWRRLSQKKQSAPVQSIDTKKAEELLK